MAKNLQFKVLEGYNKLLPFIRERRASFAKDRDFVIDVLQTGSRKAREITENTKNELLEALGISGSSKARD